jgi:hypothetical protein
MIGTLTRSTEALCLLRAADGEVYPIAAHDVRKAFLHEPAGAESLAVDFDLMLDGKYQRVTNLRAAPGAG